MKNKIITIAIIAAVIITMAVCARYIPLWSTVITIIVSICSFVGGWFGCKWWAQHVK